MPEYRIVWVIDVCADSAYEAAVAALETQRDCSSIATVFHVVEDPSCLPVDSILAGADAKLIDLEDVHNHVGVDHPTAG